MLYNQWDIVLVPFPFTDLSLSKKRPGLIISPKEYNKSNDIIIAFITSNLNTDYKIGDYLIKDWEKASLPKPSLIRMKFATISNFIINKKLGRLSDNDINSFKKELQLFFE
ncbi:MAG: type II toxin-antitoxin system PemK/MazF family toxin [Ignavibacteriae bacterium]|nr:type II toxin-antitoxin system PemK/MazF family toxin [Ignavibacteriota bacterium]